MVPVMSNVLTSCQRWIVPSTLQNSLEDLHNLMLATGSDDYRNVADSSYIGNAALDPNTDWAQVLDGSNDDAQVRGL